MVHSSLARQFPNADGRMLNDVTMQFTQYATSLAFEIHNMKQWQTRQFNGQFWTDALMQISICDPQRFNMAQDEAGVVFMQKALILPRSILDNLVRTYRNGTHDTNKLLGRVFNMTQRYESAGKLVPPHQQAITPNVMMTLQRYFGVSHECFASPFDRQLENYCSQFYDTDMYFGSLGSFFDFFPSNGSFVAHPPSDHHLIVSMYAHMVKLLTNTDQPLSFVVVCPHLSQQFDCVRDITGLRPFVRHAEMLPRGQHAMSLARRHKVYGDQNPLTSQPWRPNNDTLLFWLQNNAGADIWSVSKEAVKATVMSFQQIGAPGSNSF